MKHIQLTRRRWFLHIAALAVSVALAGLFARPSQAAEPLLTFVQWNDVHVDTNNKDWETARRMRQIEYLIDSVNTERFFPKPTFVVGVGDLVNGEGDLAKLTADFALLKTKLSKLQVPFCPVMGNHDNNFREGNSASEAPYVALFGADRINYTFRKCGIQFVMLDDSGAPGTNSTAVGAAQRKWLGGVLEASRGVPTIIAAHIPLMPVRDAQALAKSDGSRSEFAKDAEMLDLINAHRDDVLAIVSGHLHLSGVKREANGIYQIVSAGDGSYPNDFVYYQVFPDHIHVQMYSLPAEMMNPKENCHGKPRWPIDYTDADHPTGQSYIFGNPSERSFDISISPRLQRQISAPAAEKAIQQQR